jgi:hypothetical protein
MMVVVVVLFAAVPMDEDFTVAEGVFTSVINVTVIWVDAVVGGPPMGVSVGVMVRCGLRPSVTRQRAAHLLEWEMAV